jgi:hypothetical protein
MLHKNYGIIGILKYQNTLPPLNEVSNSPLDHPPFLGIANMFVIKLNRIGELVSCRSLYEFKNNDLCYRLL